MKRQHYDHRATLALLYAVLRGASVEEALRFVGGLKATRRYSSHPR